MEDVKQKKEMVLSGGFSLTPKTLDEAMQMAKLMADSELVPRDFRGKPGNVLIAVQMGAELGVSPMQAIQCIAVINGRPGIFGDLGKAILRSNGCQIDDDDIAVVQKNERARCKITRPSGESVERTFSKADAMTAKLWGKEGPWTSYPWRQMAWRAFWFAARDAAADLLKGMHGAEEMIDLPSDPIPAEVVKDDGPKRASETVTPSAQPPAPTPAAPPDGQPSAQEHKVTGTVTDITWKGFGGGVFDFIIKVEDDEGPIFLNTKDSPLAKGLKDAKEAKKSVTIVFTAGKDRNDIVRVE